MECEFNKKMEHRYNNGYVMMRTFPSISIHSGYYILHLLLFSMILVTNTLPPVIRIGKLKIYREEDGRVLVIVYFV